MVVYPEGTWYHGMTADRVPRFVQEHLVEGRPIVEWIFARNPLTSNSQINNNHSVIGPPHSATIRLTFPKHPHIVNMYRL